jgi:hypothetical protein
MNGGDVLAEENQQKKKRKRPRKRKRAGTRNIYIFLLGLKEKLVVYKV